MHNAAIRNIALWLGENGHRGRRPSLAHAAAQPQSLRK
jgi:hypothetical protein